MIDLLKILNPIYLDASVNENAARALVDSIFKNDTGAINWWQFFSFLK